MATDEEATPMSRLDDPWGDWRDHDDRPDAVEGEATRVTTLPLEDGAALSRGASEDPDAA